MMLCYPCWIQFQGRTLGLIWQSADGTEDTDTNEDTDRVLTDNGKIVSASTAEGLVVLAGHHGFGLESPFDDPQNLDGLDGLLELPVSDATCAQLLNAWNLLGDIARSVDATLDDRSPEASKCYDKLFHGNNLECITPAGEHYSPYFSGAERRLMAEILGRGRAILATHLQDNPETENGQSHQDKPSDG
jgi:hypothetical protein